MEFVKPGYGRVSSQMFLYIVSSYLMSACFFIRLKRNLEWGGGNSLNYKNIIPNSKIIETSLFGQIHKIHSKFL